MRAWGFERNEEVFESLIARYSETGRFYHTQDHVSACLRHLDRCVECVEEPREVELALWFHDAIHNPLSAANEKKSADWAALFLTSNQAPVDAIDRVYQMIPDHRDQS